jgi:hypothetical protein
MKNTSVQRAESNFRFPQAVAYFDKCHFYFPRLHEHERALLTNRHGIAPWRCEYGWMVVVPRLTPSILRDIDAALLFRDGKQYGTISRIDIAFDWPFQTQAQADAANAFLKRHTIWRYRRNGQIQTWPESGAWASKRFYQGQRPPSKNIECYSDFSAERPPKIDASYACQSTPTRHVNYPILHTITSSPRRLGLFHTEVFLKSEHILTDILNRHEALSEHILTDILKQTY